MRSLLIASFVLMASALVASAEKARFDDYKVYGLHVETTEQLIQLRTLEDENRYQFWSLPNTGGNATIMVAPHQAADFQDLIDGLRLDSWLQVENVQKLIDDESPTDVPFTADFRWVRYHTLDEINAWLSSKVAQYPSRLTNINIGATTEGRQMRVIRLSAKAGNPAIFVEANIHAREWITSATATWLLNELLTSADPEVRELATNIDWYFLVVANPDGYAFTHTSNRMWRKTRSASSALCRGVDPNRNFEFFWNQGGASSNPCSETFPGARAFSEPEARNIRDFYRTISHRSRFYLSLHAFGQFVLLPYGHTQAQTQTYAQLMSVGNSGVQAIRRRFGTNYVIGSVANVMYVATGSSADWAFGTLNTPLSYTFELRDVQGGPHGFLLPPAQIIPNCLEFFDGLRAMIRQARSLNKI